MMKAVLTDKLVEELQPNRAGLVRVWDEHPKAPRGFMLSCTPAGVKSFVLAYRAKPSRKERRIVIERAGEGAGGITVALARRLARDLRDRIAGGYDPLQEQKLARDAEKARAEAPTIDDLSDEYLQWAQTHKRPRSVVEDRSLLNQHIRRAFGKRKVADISKRQIEELYQAIKMGTSDHRGTPVRAALTVVLLSKMMSLAVEWGYRSDNPCRGVRKDPATQRRRYLDPDRELPALTGSLNKHRDRYGVDTIWLLLLTGARRSEVLTARWEMFDLDRGTWTKPASSTKQKRLHVVHLSAQALDVLKRVRREADKGLRTALELTTQAEHEKDQHEKKRLLERAKLARIRHSSPFVFPSSRKEDYPVESIRHIWSAICKDAKLRDFRLHDLRHSYASLLLRLNYHLPLVGDLLGHSRAETTARYGHIMPDFARAAAEHAGQLIIDAGRRRRTAKILKFAAR